MHDDQFNRWYVTRFDDVRQVLRDKDMSADPRKANPEFVRREDRRSGRNVDSSAPQSMLFMDDPDHRRLRGLVNKAFTLKAVEALRPRVREIADELLANIDTDEFDLMSSFAGRAAGHRHRGNARHRSRRPRFLPALVRSQRGGVLQSVPHAATRRARCAGAAGARRLFPAMIALRRAEAREDLISDMVHVEEGGNRMTDPEIVTQCNLLLIAGNVTTTDLIGNGVKALLDHPQELAKLRARPELINNAIEEILRYDSPVTNSGRNVQREQSHARLPDGPRRQHYSLARRGQSRSGSKSATRSASTSSAPTSSISHSAAASTCASARRSRASKPRKEYCAAKRFPAPRPSARGLKYRSIPRFRGSVRILAANQRTQPFRTSNSLLFLGVLGDLGERHSDLFKSPPRLRECLARTPV